MAPPVTQCKAETEPRHGGLVSVCKGDSVFGLSAQEVPKCEYCDGFEFWVLLKEPVHTTYTSTKNYYFKN